MSADRSVKPEVSVRIQGDSGQIVNVHIAERAGQVQILVRSNDPATAALLRRDMPAMRTSLEQIGWHLGSVSNRSEQVGEGRHMEEQNHGQDEHPQRNHTPEQWPEQNRRRPGPSDRWLELMNREI